MRILHASFVVALALGLASPRANAHGQTPPAVRRHALLIGISNYKVRPLEGPQYDVRVLDGVLRQQFKFDSVVTLVDAQATRQGILQAIDALETRSAPGDLVFIYYSGHGTSALDRRMKLPGLSSNTGALIPADFTRAATAKEALERLVVGSRDLRPRFERLDATRDLIVVFDSCYSGNAVRSLYAGDTADRSLPWHEVTGETSAARSGGEALFPDDDQPSPWGAQTARVEPYPYKRTLYFAASSVDEAAQDIPKRKLARHPTIDGQPHGAFTNALLNGLAGQANTNGDNTLTYQELFAYARTQVAQQFHHTPQVSTPAGNDVLLDRPVFAAKGVATVAPAAAAVESLRILAGATVPREVLSALGGIAGAAVVSAGPHDVRVEAEPRAVVVLHGSGDVLMRYDGQPSFVAPAVVTRLRRQARVHPLLNMAFPGQSFNTFVTLQTTDRRGYLLTGDQIVLDFKSEIPAYLLVLNIDVEGLVSVLYPGGPRSAEELRTVADRAHATFTVVPNQPKGTEFIKVFAFEERPAGLERWPDKLIDPQSREWDDLMAMIRGARGRRSQAILKIVTADR